jgi:hypothetical protein
MNPSMIYKLALKDWHLFKWYMLIYIVLGVSSVFVQSLQYEFAYYTGVVLLITVLIGSSAHLAMGSVLTEKMENQMSFIMGLPINVLDYILSKLIGGIAIYLTCWLPIVIAATLNIMLTEHLPNGLIPMLVMSAGQILMTATLLFCVGLLTGSLSITIVFMIIMNIAFNLFLSVVSQIPGILENIEGATAVFNTPVYKVLGIELAIILTAVAITIYIKSRKTCFM